MLMLTVPIFPPIMLALGRSRVVRGCCGATARWAHNSVGLNVYVIGGIAKEPRPPSSKGPYDLSSRCS